MLITTDRHKPEDLELWEGYKELDSITDYSPRKVELSKIIIESWCEKHADAVFFTSWGKDSVLLLDFAYRLGVKCPVVYMYTERENPDCRLVERAFLDTHPGLDYHAEFFEYERVRPKDLQWKELAQMYGHHRITGIRNDESNVRLLLYKRFGFMSDRSCRPLALWTGREVFAYIHQNNLPLCPVYGYLGGGRWERDQLRTHSLAGTAANGIGRAEWEREYYPDLLARIERRRYENNQ